MKSGAYLRIARTSSLLLLTLTLLALHIAFDYRDGAAPLLEAHRIAATHTALATLSRWAGKKPSSNEAYDFFDGVARACGESSVGWSAGHIRARTEGGRQGFAEIMEEEEKLQAEAKSLPRPDWPPSQQWCRTLRHDLRSSERLSVSESQRGYAPSRVEFFWNTIEGQIVVHTVYGFRVQATLEGRVQWQYLVLKYNRSERSAARPAGTGRVALMNKWNSPECDLSGLARTLWQSEESEKTMLLELFKEVNRGHSDAATPAGDVIALASYLDEKIKTRSVNVPTFGFDLNRWLAMACLDLVALYILVAMRSALGRVLNDPQVAMDEPWLVVDRGPGLERLLGRLWLFSVLGVPLLISGSFLAMLGLWASVEGRTQLSVIPAVVIVAACAIAEVYAAAGVTSAALEIRQRRWDLATGAGDPGRALDPVVASTLNTVPREAPTVVPLQTGPDDA